ncbi:NAD(P)-binding protein [Aspergillus campestris IBT 28561]|uniref:NAD(P)-binding protein n=1 Tax=Aspergillus campestris (strain IBT 28561) TaxID=1392248 RepID=A0A2I1CYK0_ASPC2|nr:NAD(P)-binding protein [Aspergillus campestris IBT 28561]PKY02686.1 NAD(P)-binding protein [Aspergillus campestris IBT 28561]
MKMVQKILRVGILTAGPGAQVIQTIYLPVLRDLKNSFQATVIYSDPPAPPKNGTSNGHDETLRIARTPDEVVRSSDVDLVFNFMPTEFHEFYTVAALAAGKHVMLEAPISLGIMSAKRIILAERQAPNGAKVFVASVRRYAPCVDVFRQEVASIDRIYYARCRNIAGPHAAHSVTAPQEQWPAIIPTRPSLPVTGADREQPQGEQLLNNLLQETFAGQDLSPARISLCQFLASLGCYDLGLMRDALGYPDAVSSISVNAPFYSAVFHYGDDTLDAHPYTLLYETGTDSVPRRDAHLAVYGRSKTVTIHYDLPYVPGQPVRVVVETADAHGTLHTQETVSRWEDAYRAELEALHAYLVAGTKPRTTTADAIQDLRLFQTIFDQYDRQCGTVRTPLG